MMVVAVGLAAACERSGPLRIAVVGERGLPAAAVLAAERINASGGIEGRRLQIDVVDEAPSSDPRAAIAAAEKIAGDDQVLAVIGHGGSATSLVAAQVYNHRRVPQIAPTTSSPLFSAAGPYSFRLVASDSHQAAFIAERVGQMSPAPRVAVLYVNDDYGRALRGFLNSSLAARGIPVVHDAPFLAGAPFVEGLSETVRALEHSRPTLLVWIGLIEEFRAIRKPLRQALPALRVFGTDGVSYLGGLPDLSEFTGDRVVAHVDVSADDPELQTVRKQFEAASGRDFTDAAALIYDAVGIIAEGFRAGATSREELKNYLETSAASGRAFRGITGSIAFDGNGDAIPKYVLLEVANGRMRRLP